MAFGVSHPKRGENEDLEKGSDGTSIDKESPLSPSSTTMTAVDIEATLKAQGEAYLEQLKSFNKAFDDSTTDAAQRQASLGSRRGSSMFDVDEDLMYFISKKVKVSISFSNLTYSIPIGKRSVLSKCCGGSQEVEKKVILDDLSASVPAGRLVAVMGPTGCGKTSLINALAGRLEYGGELSGEVLVNGKPRDRSYRALVAYVMQDDVLFPNLTVQETFEFAARMRLPKKVPSASKMKLVDGIINELGLSKARNTRIGNAIYRGVSGGERKRTNIGIELLSGASLIFLDEPTSGLDAFQAMNVMESLWTLTANGRTIITTIHQPRSSIFKMFDLLLLLSEGKTMYYGPAKAAIEFFSSAHFACPVNFNPADFFLDVVSMDFRSKHAEDSSRARIKLLAERFAHVRQGYVGDIEKDHQRAIENCDDCRNLSVVVFPNNPLTEFGLLLRRAWKQQSRDVLPIAITFVQTVVVGFILAAIYSDMSSSATPVQDELGILFFVCIFSAFGAMFQALNTFPTDRAVVNRERASKMYHVLPYYVARFICDMPTRVGQGLLFGCIVYWIVGLNPAASAFFIFCALLIVEGLAAQGFGICISAVCPNEKVAFAIAPAITIVLILVGGFYVNQDAIPPWISWLKYLSHLYWAYMGLTINDFSGRDGWETCVSTVNGTCVSTVEQTGDDVLDRLGFNANDLWLAFVVLIGLLVFYNSMGYVFLRLSKPKTMPVVENKKKA